MGFFINIIAYGALFAWFVFSVIQYSDSKKSNPYILQLIPPVFSTIGVFGTFVGIAYGLWNFNVKDINGSIPELLSGMTTAFLTSIFGIVLSTIFSAKLASINKQTDDSVANQLTPEQEALSAIVNLLQNNQQIDAAHRAEMVDLNKRQQEYLRELATNLAANNESQMEIFTSYMRNMSLSQQQQQTQFQQFFDKLELLTSGLKSALSTLQKQSNNDNSQIIAVLDKNGTQIYQQLKALEQAHQLNADTLFQKVEHQSKDICKNLGELKDVSNKNTTALQKTLNTNAEEMRQEFQTFAQLLAKNNTEALVDVMKTVITDFNTQMNELIQRLVKENFEELNSSVKRLNEWQIINKEQVEQLINQFKGVSNNLEIAAKTINIITNNTQKLTDQNGHLAELIKELQSVMINDTKFSSLINQTSKTIDTLANTASEFDSTTMELNKWVKQEHNFKNSVNTFLVRLEEVGKIKAYNEEFWQGTKKQLQEGVSLVHQANKHLADSIENLDNKFYTRLNTTLTTLDKLIQSFMLNAVKK